MSTTKGGASFMADSVTYGGKMPLDDFFMLLERVKGTNLADCMQFNVKFAQNKAPTVLVSLKAEKSFDSLVRQSFKGAMLKDWAKFFSAFK